MKRLLLLLAFLLLLPAGVAEAQWCPYCHQPPSGEYYCGMSTFNGQVGCEATQWGCWRSGEMCLGADGEQCRPKCIPVKWTSATELPEKAPWTVAAAKVTRLEERKKS